MKCQLIELPPSGMGIGRIVKKQFGLYAGAASSSSLPVIQTKE